MLINLQEGQSIFAKRTLTEAQIRHWKYAHETAQFGGGFMPGTDFKVVEVNWATPGNFWLRIEVPGSDPARHLKISGEEYAMNFNTHRG